MSRIVFDQTVEELRVSRNKQQHHDDDGFCNVDIRPIVIHRRGQPPKQLACDKHDVDRADACRLGAVTEPRQTQSKLTV